MEQARLAGREHMAQPANSRIGFDEIENGNKTAFCTNNIQNCSPVLRMQTLKIVPTVWEKEDIISSHFLAR